MLFRDCGITGLRDYGISSLRDYVIQDYFKIRCKSTAFWGYVQVPKTRIFAFFRGK